MQSHNNRRKRSGARVASRDQRKQTQTQSSHSVSIYHPLNLLLFQIVCRSRLMIETQAPGPRDPLSGVLPVEILLCLQTATLYTQIFFEIQLLFECRVSVLNHLHSQTKLQNTVHLKILKLLLFCFYFSKIAPTPIRTATTSDNEILTSTYCPCSSLFPRLVMLHLTTASQNTKALFGKLVFTCRVTHLLLQTIGPSNTRENCSQN